MEWLKLLKYFNDCDLEYFEAPAISFKCFASGFDRFQDQDQVNESKKLFFVTVFLFFQNL